MKAFSMRPAEASPAATSRRPGSFDGNRRRLKRALRTLKHVRHLKLDLLNRAQLAHITTLRQQAAAAFASASPDEMASCAAKVEAWVQEMEGGATASAWTPLVRSILVTAALLAAIQVYFFRLALIPSASMEPTVCGPQIVKSGSAPSWETLLADRFLQARAHAWIKAPEDGVVGPVRFQGFEFPSGILGWSHLTVGGSTCRTWMDRSDLELLLEVTPGQEVRQGDVIAAGSVQSGDIILVDRLTHHFAGIRRGTPVVFRTVGIPRLEESVRKAGIQGSIWYIKRVAGLPGDTLEIRPPVLWINGSPATGSRVFELQASRSSGYAGYFFHPDGLILSGEGKRLTVPDGSFVALGDNAAQSWDSRVWGTAPLRNIVGGACWILYPFTSRWGPVP